MTKEILTNDAQLMDILQNPNNYPAEQLVVAYDALIEIEKQQREYKRNVTDKLKQLMRESGAEKLMFSTLRGEPKLCSLKAGRVTPVKDLEDRWKAAGYDPLELGKYEFKPSWSTASKIKKFGGDKAKLIDELFTREDDTIEIK